jgi:hypothetical protein
LEEAALATAFVLLCPIFFVVGVFVLPVVGVTNVVSLCRVRGARIGDVLSSNGNMAYILSVHPLLVLVRRNNGSANIIAYDHAWDLMEDLLFNSIVPVSVGPDKMGLVELVEQVASVCMWDCGVPTLRAKNEAMRKRALWMLQRPVRLVQRTWRAHVLRRLRWAVGVVEAAALDVLYRPGGAHYHDAARRWHRDAITDADKEDAITDADAVFKQCQS